MDHFDRDDLEVKHFSSKSEPSTTDSLLGCGGGLGLALDRAPKHRKQNNHMAAVANAYLEFAAEAPALYEAMFALTLNVHFGDTAVSPELPFAFSQILQLFSEQGTTAEVISELFWASLEWHKRN